MQETPLSSQQAQWLSQLVDGLSTEQLAWVRGFLAGINHSVRQAGAPAATQANTGATAPALTILYGSQTGHAQGVAEQAKARAVAAGFKVDLFAMGDYKASRLKNDKLLLVAVSTQGEGEPPDDARDFYEFLHGEKAPRLAGTRFAVLGLGDSSYEKFCQAGKDFDARLAALGAERLVPRVDSDVDYDAPAERWIEDAVEALSRVSVPAGTAGTTATTAGNASAASLIDTFTLAALGGSATSSTGAAASQYSRKHPFDAGVIENITLSGRGSSKEVHHIELSLEGSDLTYEPGDALGVVVKNDATLVDELIDTLALDPQATTTTQDSTLSLRDAFLGAYDITTLSRAFLEKYAALAESSELKTLLAAGNETALREYLHGRDVLDVVRQFPARQVKAAEFVGTLRTLQPRLYSIASSLVANPEAVHITVGAVRFESHGRARRGVASTYLADVAREGASVPVYIEANRNFKLPADSNAPVIMIGPGTGIAPFRAFVEERQALDAPGRNWLFFGDRNFRTDFLYQREWQRYVKDGALTRIDLAFSRDTEDKVYVQHRMREQGKALYAWLQEGAHLYVCGDAEQMARDVNTALVDIVAEHGGLSPDAAAEYVKALQREKRYQRDVY
ncbi:sulfite reductase [NADPH] flavoprotein alpha-component [Pandoraea morbifera]|uniref:Sulfite reductase [NADPH] flavoprotein alpha-component n=1 Tax=Pandoraea morbifera TaxID=2508300 RepID=A0A5E4S947_9BURK|nr:assimilatory sulfite reductase (NADPH) flavoprotein subunit [Pandoraea morbifera]VVD71094.1 sulfite reductase [NADPH] flavoprotein alpha-component [Pandoraea morbifera]